MHPGQSFHGGGFASTIGTNQAKDFARKHIEVDSVQRRNRANLLP
jgi:hypothetical protein